MKKIAIFALVCALGVTMAFASSLKVPWYVDNAPSPAGGLPPSTNILSLVYLTSNSDTVIECTITYFTQSGVNIGPPDDGVSNTFSISPNASIAFRPYADDDSQEDPTAGKLVPNRPPTAGVPAGNDGAKNGSILIEWTGASDLVQGQLTTWNGRGGAQGSFGYAHLLPPGAGGGV